MRKILAILIVALVQGWRIGALHAYTSDSSSPALRRVLLRRSTTRRRLFRFEPDHGTVHSSALDSPFMFMFMLFPRGNQTSASIVEQCDNGTVRPYRTVPCQE